jgi:hypothetical protein
MPGYCIGNSENEQCRGVIDELLAPAAKINATVISGYRVNR